MIFMLFLEKKIQKKNANQPTLKNIEMFPETRHFLALYELYLLFNPYFVDSGIDGYVLPGGGGCVIATD